MIRMAIESWRRVCADGVQYYCSHTNLNYC